MEECVCLRAELSIQLRELLSAWVNQLTGWLGVNTQTPAVNSVCCEAKTRELPWQLCIAHSVNFVYITHLIISCMFSKIIVVVKLYSVYILIIKPLQYNV